MSSARVLPFQREDATLAEEARAARSIVEGIRAGDIQKERELVNRYSRGLRYFLARKINDQDLADDLLQDTFCIAIAKLRGTDIDSPERLAGYLRGIAIRVAMNAGRRRKRDPILMESEAVAAIPDEQPRPYQLVAREQTVAAVHELLRAMPVQRDRELLTRYFVHDEDKKDICVALKLDSLHFNRVLFRAKARFKKVLNEKLAGEGLGAV